MAAEALNPAESRVAAALAPIAGLVHRGEHRAALAALADLERVHARSGRLWQERAACLRALGDIPGAIAGFQQAVDLNDALAESWQALIELCTAAGRAAQAENAARCLTRLKSLPAELAQASGLLNEGELDAAEDLTRAFLRRHGAHVEGMRLLAQICMKHSVHDDAEVLLEHVLEAAPDYLDARYEYATVLTQRRRYRAALAEARRLLQVLPDNPAFRLLYAKSCDGLGEYDEALRIYRQLLAQQPGSGELQVLIANVLKTRGAQREAIASFQAAAAAPGSFSAAVFGLANTKAYRFPEAQVTLMREREAAPAASLFDRYNLCFALGKALEDRAEYAESFRYYALGNALKRSELRYSPERSERQMRQQAEICTAELFAARLGSGCPRPDPIFVLGLPRSGSTLIEQILASHSKVDGTLELPEIPRLVGQFRDRTGGAGPTSYPAVLTDLPAERLRLMGEFYLEETRVYRRGAPFFVDKLPGNFQHIGFIHLILPNARIIDARRTAMACCFSNFKQLYANGQEFSYDLGDLGRYYRSYVELMDHWDRVLPGRILRVRHEDVVNDLEGSVRRLLDYCGLEFEPACLEFYKTSRGVRTVSSEQVRRPIFRDGIEQWRHFEPWLGPLKDALGALAP